MYVESCWPGVVVVAVCYRRPRGCWRSRPPRQSGRIAPAPPSALPRAPVGAVSWGSKNGSVCRCMTACRHQGVDSIVGAGHGAVAQETANKAIPCRRGQTAWVRNLLGRRRGLLIASWHQCRATWTVQLQVGSIRHPGRVQEKDVAINTYLPLSRPSPCRYVLGPPWFAL